LTTMLYKENGMDDIYHPLLHTILNLFVDNHDQA